MQSDLDNESILCYILYNNLYNMYIFNLNSFTSAKKFTFSSMSEISQKESIKFWRGTDYAS